MTNQIETKQYPDGTTATGVAPLPEASPRDDSDFPPLDIQHDLTQAQRALVDKLWLELRDNPELRYARQRLSLHELREIVRAIVLAAPEKREFTPEVDESIRAPKAEREAELAAIKWQKIGPAIYLVPTDSETFERHEGAPPPMCDYEGPLYALPVDDNDAERSGLEGFSLWFSREQWGAVIDGLILERDRSLGRKKANSESTSNAKADMCAELIRAVGDASDAAMAKGE